MKKEKEKDNTLFVMLGLFGICAIVAIISFLIIPMPTDNTADTTIYYGTDYRKAVKDGDFEAAHEIVNELHEAYLQEERYDNEEDFNKAKNAYFNALGYVYENEIRLIVTQDANCGEKIAFLISEIPLDGDIPNQGICDQVTAIDAVRADHREGDPGLPWSRYIYSVQAVKKICDKTISLAISLKNEDLARAVAEQYKDDVEFTVECFKWTAEYSTKSKDAAIEKINAAFGKAK